jgi:hypothetical protein
MPLPLPDSARHWKAIAAALLVVAATVALAPLALPGMWQGHDLLFEVVRGAQYAVALRDQGFPPRLAPDLAQGYGYPIFVYFPHTFLLLSTLLAGLVGWSMAAELVLGGAVLFGAAGVVVLARRLVALPSALLAGAVWLVSPYLAYDVYVRSAFAETMGLSLLPWVVWAALVLTDAQARFASRLVAIAVGAVFVCSHNLTVLLALPPLLTVAVVRYLSAPGVRTVGWLLLAAAWAATMAAFYLLPLVLESSAIAMEWDPLGPFGVLRNALWSDVPGGGASLLERRALLWLLGVGALCGAVGLTAPEPPRRVLTGALLCVLAAQLWLATTWSAPAWRALPALEMVGFPSRLLGHGTLAAALLFALAVERLRATSTGAIVVALATATAIGGAVSTRPLEHLGRINVATLPTDAAFLRQAHITTTVVDEFLPTTVTRRPTVPAEPTFGFSVPSAVVDEQAASAMRHTAVLTTTEPGTLLVRRFQVPGWVLRVNGERVEPQLTSFGTLRVDLEPGRHDIALLWEDPAHRRVANGISVAAWLLWVAALAVALVLPAWRRRRAAEQG